MLPHRILQLSVRRPPVIELNRSEARPQPYGRLRRFDEETEAESIVGFGDGEASREDAW